MTRSYVHVMHPSLTSLASQTISPALESEISLMGNHATSCCHDHVLERDLHLVCIHNSIDCREHGLATPDFTPC